MTEVDGEGLAPDAEVADVEDRQVAGEREDHRLPVVAPQRGLLAVFVRDADPLRRGPRASAHPEFGVWKEMWG